MQNRKQRHEERKPKLQQHSIRIPFFKTAWSISRQSLLCPECLQAEREVHHIEKDGRYRCQYCCFNGDRAVVHEKNATLKIN